MNLRKEIRKTIREQVQLTSPEATEKMDAIEVELRVFVRKMSDDLQSLKSYFELTDNNYAARCVQKYEELIYSIENLDVAFENLKDNFNSAM
jgi:hypothetical protein